jgi:hypothetical protein
MAAGDRGSSRVAYLDSTYSGSSRADLFDVGAADEVNGRCVDGFRRSWQLSCIGVLCSKYLAEPSYVGERRRAYIAGVTRRSMRVDPLSLDPKLLFRHVCRCDGACGCCSCGGTHSRTE